MAQDLLTTYKYGWKTSYYQNTNDMKTDEVAILSNNDEVGIQGKSKLGGLLDELSTANEEECESCAI